MKDIIRHLIEHALDSLVASDLLPADGKTDIQVETTKDRSHGDYASNIALMLAKQARMKPRDLAERIVQALPTHEQIAKVEIAGPGFLNFFQDQQQLAAELDAALDDPHLNVTKSTPRQIVVIDLSSPNLAKEMHVGHLRSTIIGDAVARVLEYLGDTVIRQNHVGDWGTQFGMLLAHLKEQPADDEAELADLESFYRAAKKRFDESPQFAERAREMVVQLQSGESECLRLWQRFNDISLRHSQEVYDRLDVKLSQNDVRGESAYNDDLPAVVADLTSAGLLTEDNCALCVFLDEFKNTEGKPLPVIIQKTGGGYLYATTDLAAIRYRVQTLHADRVLYFVDQRQSLHFQQVFEVARRAGFVPTGVTLEHMGFGTMNGADGKPFKTRDGGTVKLIDLLIEAESRAWRLVQARNQQRDDALPEDELKQIARVVGIDSVKYADLSKHRTSDYSFNFDQMLSFEGNTAPYLLYAYTRVASLFRRLGLSYEQIVGGIRLERPEEQALASHLAQFGDQLNTVGQKGQPHLLCAYLYELAGLFSSFYEHCPILTAEDPKQRDSRLRLAALTGRVLKQGLELLGLQTLERM